MAISTNLGQRLGILATACLLSVALPVNAAWAQKVKNKTPAAEATAQESTSFNVDIPSIEAVDSNLDDDTLRAIFSGELVENADALAGLTATSITIPQITLDASTVMDGETTVASITFSDLVLTDVTDGIAATVALGGMTFDGGEQGSGSYGEVTAANFNIGGVLGLYGLVDGGEQTELETIYTDFVFEGGSFSAEDISCTMGSMSAAEFKARPFGFSFPEMMTMLETLEEDEMPSPEMTGKLVRMYANMFTSFQTSAVEFDGFDCSGTDDGRPMSFSVDSMSVGAMSPGIYPAVSMDGFDVTVEGDGTFKIGNVTIKAMDLSGPLAVIDNAPEALDEAWFMANARALIPAFEGFSLSDVLFDIPDPENAGERIAAEIGAFDLTLGNYINGIPGDILNTADNIVVDLPENSDDEQIQQLIDMGLSSVNTSYVLDTSWSEAEDTIIIDEISMTGADLGKVLLSGVLANASEALFSLDENEAMMAAMGVTIRSLKVDATDAGLGDILLASIAAEQGGDASTLRPVYAGLAEGSILGLMAGAAEAQKLGSAVSAFISGKAKNLTIEMTSKEPAGLGMMDFMAAEDDPTSLIGKVNIDATAK